MRRCWDRGSDLPIEHSSRDQRITLEAGADWTVGKSVIYRIKFTKKKKKKKKEEKKEKKKKKRRKKKKKE